MIHTPKRNSTRNHGTLSFPNGTLKGFIRNISALNQNTFRLFVRHFPIMNRLADALVWVHALPKIKFYYSVRQHTIRFRAVVKWFC